MTAAGGQLLRWCLSDDPLDKPVFLQTAVLFAAVCEISEARYDVMALDGNAET